jgi:hypothetical protein
MLLRGILGMTISGLCIAMTSGQALGQVGVETDPGGGNIFKARNTGAQSADGVALYGESQPAPNWGIGVTGSGGYRGVQGFANMGGTGNRYGGLFGANSGSLYNYGVYASASGGTGSYAGYFSGNVHVTGTFTNPSDERLKRNIAALDRPLSKVMALRPATYEFDGSQMKVKGLPKGRQIGLLAGDLESVLPELVQENPVSNPEDDDKSGKASPQTFLSVNYIGLIPVLVGAIKEQQAEIEALKAALKK